MDIDITRSPGFRHLEYLTIDDNVILNLDIDAPSIEADILELATKALAKKLKLSVTFNVKDKTSKHDLHQAFIQFTPTEVLCTLPATTHHLVPPPRMFYLTALSHIKMPEAVSGSFTVTFKHRTAYFPEPSDSNIESLLLTVLTAVKEKIGGRM